MLSLVRSLSLALALLLAVVSSPAHAQAPAAPVKLIVHGGAGTILPQHLTPEREAAYRAELEAALRAGHAVLTAGGSSLDAVVAAIQVMEDSPLFNAGRGAVYTNAGTHELDASLMDGATRAAGAVAGVRTVRSPIALARRVMEASPHVMMAGEGAEAFAREQGLEQVENSYFDTERRRRQLDELQQRERGADMGAADPLLDDATTYADPFDRKHGTVGAVALDRRGHLAAGTSTGGMTNKRWGRVGDAPVIGAGTYADDASCAVSATGHGEYFIRGVVAYDVCAMMRYTGLSLTEAANAVIHGRLTELGGTGGIIAMDARGNVAMPFNTAGMYRGVITADGTVTVEIYGPNVQR